MRIHRVIIGTMFLIIGVVFCLILVRINEKFSVVEVETGQQIIFTVMVAISTLQLATSYCLILNKAWSSKISIFIAAFNLVIFPVGTLAGIYYFWYLLKTSSNTNSIVRNL